MTQFEVKKPSIDEKEAVKKETVKEISNLKKEVEKGPITKKDVEAFTREAKERMAETMGRSALEAAEQGEKTEKGILIDPKELNMLDTIFGAIIISVRQNPGAYLEKDEKGEVYIPKHKFVKLISSFHMSEEEHDFMMKVMQKYEIE